VSSTPTARPSGEDDPPGTFASIQSRAERSSNARAIAVEVLVATPAVRNLVREGKTHQIYSIMQAGGRFGMQTMDQSLANLVKAGKITQNLAYERCHDPEELNRLIGGAGASFDAGMGAAAAAGISLGGSMY